MVKAWAGGEACGTNWPTEVEEIATRYELEVRIKPEKFSKGIVPDRSNQVYSKSYLVC
jgi:hypothetical protein